MQTGSAASLIRLAADADELFDVVRGTLGASEPTPEDVHSGLRAAVAIEPAVLMRGPVVTYLELLDRGIASTTVRDEVVGHARRVRGRLLARRGADEAAKADLEAACAIGEACGARDLVVEAGLSLGALHQKARRLDEAAQRYEAVIEASQGERLRAEASALANLAGIAQDGRRLEEAVALYEDSLALLDVVGDPRLSAWGRINSAILLQERGERAEARARYTRAVEEGTRIEDHWLTGYALTNSAMLEMEDGHLDQAHTQITKARSLLARVGAQRLEALTIGRLAAVQAMRGHLREALGAAVLAERMASRHGPTIRGPVRLLRAFVDVAQARAAEASGDVAAAENAWMAMRARIREATTAEPGASAVVDVSDDARATLRVLDAWTRP
jgi:tetratricopeptide (TPR) repeat protein